MNETIKILLERRSVRGYKEDLVPEEVLNEILEAGEYAPSGMGQQGTLMVVTQNPELVAKLSKMNADVMGTESDPLYGAPTVVVVYADNNMTMSVIRSMGHRQLLWSLQTVICLHVWKMEVWLWEI